jgi:hypothetical protein
VISGPVERAQLNQCTRGRAERQRAQSAGSWNLFADLVERAPAEANDDCAVAFDWFREATG